MGPWRAVIAALLADGCGYLYVGRPWWALLVWAARAAFLVALIASRLVIHLSGFYLLVAGSLVFFVGVPWHTYWYAQRHPVQPRMPWNSAGVYVAFIVAAWLGTSWLGEYVQGHGSQAFSVPSLSMSPTIEPGDRVVADTWRYRGAPPQVGDIVVFTLPSQRDVYVKRVVALPGDHIAIREGNAVRNGVPLAEPYLHAPLSWAYAPRNLAYQPVLGADEYYVLGDLRDNSKDSRAWGPIRGTWIIGRVEYRWLSLDGWIPRFGRLPQSLVKLSSH